MQNTLIVILLLLLMTGFYIWNPPENEHFDGTLLMLDTSSTEDESIIAALTLTKKGRFLYRQINLEQETFLNFGAHQKGTYKTEIFTKDAYGYTGRLSFIPNVEGKNPMREGDFTLTDNTLTFTFRDQKKYNFSVHESSIIYQ